MQRSSRGGRQVGPQPLCRAAMCYVATLPSPLLPSCGSTLGALHTVPIQDGYGGHACVLMGPASFGLYVNSARCKRDNPRPLHLGPSPPLSHGVVYVVAPVVHGVYVMMHG